ncbi:hypothetical protein ACJIZ3_004418 [Penstemon smallii]|uniref:SKP1-like protein n=1 Tax=Penstemon smallii TaxID=265156 RepID=A0ABD3S1Z2_9LAMI
MSSFQAKPSSSTSSFELEKNPELDIKIVLKSSDNSIHFVKKSVIAKSVTIKNLIDDGCADNGGIIPLQNVNKSTLLSVLHYLNIHAELSDEGSEIKVFDENFTKDFSFEKKCDLILAANYLDIKELLDLMNQKIADFIKNKQVEEVRKIFNIANDFTVEEEAAIRNENAWAFEDINKDT